MADVEKKVNDNTEELQTVDEILAEILNEDGTFNEGFNNLFAKYMGISHDIEIPKPNVDISDRTDEEFSGERAVYDSKDVKFNIEKSIDERIEDKLPDDIKRIYAETSYEAQRPEFTSTGAVKYPTMGTGESEQRVVYDADWEQKAKNEAARLDRVRRDRMLRGDSAYARTFVAGGMYMNQNNLYIDNIDEGSAYIDPLSRDEDFERGGSYSEYFNSSKKPFFQTGFSVIQKNNVAASGKTEKRKSGNNTKTQLASEEISEDVFDSFASSYEKEKKRKSSWLEVEDKEKIKQEKKKNKSKKKNNKTEQRLDNNLSSEQIHIENQPKQKKSSDVSFDDNSDYLTQQYEAAMIYYDESEVDIIADETKELRGAVNEIVNKYDKRTKDDEIKRIKKEEKKAQEKKEQELLEQKRLEELEKVKANMSATLITVIDEEAFNNSFDDYDDFSSEENKYEIRKEKEKLLEKTTKKKEQKKEASPYLEKLTTEKNALSDDGEENMFNNQNNTKTKNQKNKRKGGK